jgi:hypothetical protein
MRPRPLLLAGVLGALLALGAPAFAAADEDETSTVEITVAGGELEISVKSATKNLGTVENSPNGTFVTGNLGEVTVRDNRNAPQGTQLKPKKGQGISAGNIRYTRGTVDKEGDCTVRASGTVNLNRSRPVVTASEITGNNVASWTPTITVRIPAGAAAGTYTGTITHSVL